MHRTPARNEYAELKRIIKQQGLLDKQPAYYTYKILLTLGMLALSLTFLLVIDNLWLQLLNAAFLAFVFTQIGFRSRLWSPADFQCRSEEHDR